MTAFLWRSNRQLRVPTQQSKVNSPVYADSRRMASRAFQGGGTLSGIGAAASAVLLLDDTLGWCVSTPRRRLHESVACRKPRRPII
jgi:hypothetical protein